MSSENKLESMLNLADLTNMLDRLDAETKLVAQNLDDDRYIYHAYAVVDSLNSSYSMFKYYFELFVNDDTSIHDFMSDPWVWLGIGIETTVFVSYAFFASIFDGEKEDEFKQFIAETWPYFRDISKALKNTYKGFRSTLFTLSLLSDLDFKYLLLPLSLGFGVLSAANRIWLRSMVEDRKLMMTDNKTLLLEIIKPNSVFTLNESLNYLGRIQRQSLESQNTAYVCVTLGGVIDGLYLYIGVLTLVPMSPALFSVVSALSFTYVLFCILTRIYEEYDYQVRLSITQTKCQLAIAAKQLETAYLDLLNSECLGSDEHKNLEIQVCKYIKQFIQLHQELQNQSTRSYFISGVLGIRNGLYGYNAIASFIFLLATFLSLGGLTLPPAVLACTVILGMVLIAGMFCHTLWMHHQKTLQNSETKSRTYTLLETLRTQLKHSDKNVTFIDIETFKACVIDGLVVEKSQQNFYQEWFEVFRSFFSGLGKGQKFIEFILNSLQTMDEQGNYHNTPLMIAFGIINAIIFALVLGIRALARGFRPPLGQVNLEEGFIHIDMTLKDKDTPEIKQPTSIDSETPCENVVVQDAKVEDVVVQDAKVALEPTPTASPLTNFSIFPLERSCPPAKNIITPAFANTIQGLT